MPSATQAEPVTTRCRYCGTELPGDAEACPSCGHAVSTQSTKFALAVTLFLIFAGFALTQSYVNFHRTIELSLGRRWFTRGEQAMQANEPKFAAEAYRSALNYDRENEQYRLRLAQALLADHRLPEARAHLITLWEHEPADGEINLTLARLEAQRGTFNEAVRYYNDAINGVWQNDPREQRTAARFELARYFIQQGNMARAQAELLALLADAPSASSDQLTLGQLLLQVHDPAHAVQAFGALVSKEAGNAQAWLGEGQAYLALGNYAEAERSSSKAVEHDSNLPNARQQLELTRELLRLDPALRGLSLAQRAERVAEAFSAAIAGLSSCAAQKNIDLTAAAPVPPAGAVGTASDNGPASPPNALNLLYTSGLQKQRMATEAALRANPDALEPIMQYVFAVERATASVCSDMNLTDRALLTLAQHEGEGLR